VGIGFSLGGLFWSGMVLISGARLRGDKHIGMTLIEILVALSVTCVVALLVFSFYRYWMGQMIRQKMVATLQGNLRETTQSIDRYLVSCGVGEDSIFFDPHRLLSDDWVDGGHRVFKLSPDSLTLTAYGNFTGSVASVKNPMLFTTEKALKVDKPNALRGHSFVYISAGSAQEVAQVAGIDADGTVRFTHDMWVPYPKGTLVFPLERLVIKTTAKNHLQVRRETASGKPGFTRDFEPSGYPGDSLQFKVTSLNRSAGQVAYTLRFLARTKGRAARWLERKADQTVLVRGF
jgi:hypothetical protein